MAIRNAKTRPHCVDIAPSVFASRNTPSASRDAQKRTVQTDIYTGAVRRSNQSASQQGSTHVGKCAIAFALITGAAVWTTGSSQSLTPVGNQETLQAALIPPAFFFDDDADALERNQLAIQTEKQSAIAPKIEFVNADPFSTKNTTETVTRNGDLEVQGDLIALAAPEIHSDLPVNSSDDPATLADTSISLPTQADNALADQSHDAITLPNAKPATLIPDPANTSGVHEITVKPGDTLSGILHKNGLKVDQMNQLLTHEVVKDHLSNIDVGQIVDLTLDDAGDFKRLTTRVGSDRRVNIERTQAGFDVSTVELPVERQRVATSGNIDQSLYLAAERANLKESTIMELANIFQWELDFARDIQKGDGFSLVYDRLYREGEYIGDGDILAAEFVRGGKSYKAILFTTDDGTSGYYSPEGESKRRTFMRHPVDVVRITSRFDPNRLHPVLHQIRAHRGVDYGSPHGSPIYATADGRVTYSGNKNAYGKTVVLKHGEKFSTLYAHMSRISDKSKVGKRVKQGDVIGYVGKTGRVTGTHLHYEFRVNGKQIDPLKVELPAAAPIDEKYRGRLKALAEEMSLLMDKAHENANKQVATASPHADALNSIAQQR